MVTPETAARLHLAPLGDFPHAHGIQRIDPSALHEMARHFKSLRARVTRLFGGLAIYIGHPDAPDLRAHYADDTAYGWIHELEIDAEGLFGLASWSSSGTALLRERRFRYLSPFWEAEEIGHENGRAILRPVELISVGLTNQPNLPVRPLANEAGPQSEPIRLLIENALRDGRLTPAQIPFWVRALAHDFPAQSERLEKAAPVIHTRTITGQFGSRRLSLANQPSRAACLSQLIREAMKAGRTYDEAWEWVKKNHPGLFEEMEQPRKENDTSI